MQKYYKFTQTKLQLTAFKLQLPYSTHLHNKLDMMDINLCEIIQV